MKVGEIFSYQRSFTNEEVIQFGELTQNKAPVHVETDSRGRLMVHGLLTASLPIKIGADLNMIGQEVDLKFMFPVYTGDTITCQLLIEEIEPKKKGTKVWSSWICTNQDNETVLTGKASGIRLSEPLSK